MLALPCPFLQLGMLLACDCAAMLPLEAFLLCCDSGICRRSFIK